MPAPRKKRAAKDPARIMGTTEMRKKFLVALKKTAGDRKGAAGLIGVNISTVEREMKHDGRFRRNVQIAEHRIRGEDMKTIRDSGDWKAVVWLLQRKYPDLRDDRFTTPEMLSLAISEVVDHIAKVAGLSVETLNSLRSEVAGLIGAEMEGSSVDRGDGGDVDGDDEHPASPASQSDDGGSDGPGDALSDVP